MSADTAGEGGSTRVHFFQWSPITPGQLVQIAIILIGGTWAVSYFKNTQENVQTDVATIQRTLDTNVVTKGTIDEGDDETPPAA